MTVAVVVQCFYCKHLRRWIRGRDGRLTCDAYPEGIPREILVMGGDHRKPRVGDHGILFDPVDEDAKQYVESLYDER